MNTLKQVEKKLGHKLTHGEIGGHFVMLELCKLQNEITQEEYTHVRNELILRLTEKK